MRNGSASTEPREDMGIVERLRAQGEFDSLVTKASLLRRKCQAALREIRSAAVVVDALMVAHVRALAAAHDVFVDKMDQYHAVVRLMAEKRLLGKDAIVPKGLPGGGKRWGDVYPWELRVLLDFELDAVGIVGERGGAGEVGEQ